jgi:hypothetical protein
MAETRLYKSRPKLLGHVAVGLTLALLCPLIAFRAESASDTTYIAGIGGALIFVIGAVFSARDLFKHEPMLVLDDRGVSGPGIDTMRFIPWSAIDSVSLADRRKRGVLLAVDEHRLGAAEREAAGIRKPGRDARGNLLAQIRVADLSIKADELAKLIAEGVRAEEKRA